MTRACVRIEDDPSFDRLIAQVKANSDTRHSQDSVLGHRDRLLERVAQLEARILAHRPGPICLLCLTDEARVATYPCAHLSMCEDCAARAQELGTNKKCCICRRDVIEIGKIYYQNVCVCVYCVLLLLLSPCLSSSKKVWWIEIALQIYFALNGRC